MEHTNGVLELRRVIVERLQKAAEEMVKRVNVALDAIYEVVVGANATMLHALLGIPLKSLGTAPLQQCIYTTGYCFGKGAGLCAP